MSSGEVTTRRIETKIPSRLDRLPWGHFHRLVIGGLGTVWILDGLEVTMVGSVAARMTSSGSGIAISAGQIALAGSLYVVGACLGALFFGQLTDKYGRKKLFMITLGVYLLSTAATAFSVWPWFFFVFRFLTGAGIGGEYSAINSAIDELMPARLRGRIDLIINGSYWLGSAGGGALALFFLDKAIFPVWLGWRLGFGVGAVLSIVIMLVRRNVPESPRWLFIHGREEEAESIVDDIESGLREDTGQELEEVPDDETLTIRQRETISFKEIASVAFRLYPRRAILGFCLFVGQAFLYNGVTFNLGTIISSRFGVSSGRVPLFIIAYAIGNFLGPLLLGRLFDTVGRKPMISGTYLGSAAVAGVFGVVFAYTGLLGAWTFDLFVIGIFFLASAGASAAYLTVSEIFPMETRALAIAFFYAIGTGAGGIIGPLIFGNLEGTDFEVAVAFWIGAAVMALGGIVELFLGVKAEQQQLEDIATPLTVEEADGEDAPDQKAKESEGAEEPEPSPQRSAARQARELADDERARAAEHRAAAHEQRAEAAEGEEDAEERSHVEQLLADIAEIRASMFDERAAAADERATAESTDEEHVAEAARQSAEAAEERARGHEHRAEALASEHPGQAHRHAALADAALERARAREQRALAEEARGRAADGGEGDPDGAAEAARAEVHEAWAAMHAERAHGQERRAEGDEEGVAESERSASALEERALAAASRVEAAEQRAQAEGERSEEADAQEVGRRREAATERHAAEERIRARMERRRVRERSGLRRYRPGPGRGLGARGMPSSLEPASDRALDREIEIIAHAVAEHGETERRELAKLVGARYWGPGVFRRALRESVEDGRVRRAGRATFAPAGDQAADDED